MFKKQTTQLIQAIQRYSYATQSSSRTATTTTIGSKILPNIVSEPPKYVLTTLRSFPSLEPHGLLPVANDFLNTPLRRDILWRAAIKEADCARVGASNPPGRGDFHFSRKKLIKQKGSGKARVGDGNSPIRINGARALARTAPNDFSTDLPFQVYANAFRVALSEYYRKGHLFIVGNEEDGTSNSNKSEFDSFELEVVTSDYHSIEYFIKRHDLKNLNLLFITQDYNKSENLTKAISHYPSSRLNLKNPEDLEVREILKANRIFIDKASLKWLAAKYAERFI